jgi:hypothetical protein
MPVAWKSPEANSEGYKLYAKKLIQTTSFVVIKTLPVAQSV